MIDNAYNEVTTWRKNTFLVPYGKTGRNFIDQLTKHIDDWKNRSPMQHLALKAVIVLIIIIIIIIMMIIIITLITLISLFS